MIFIVSDITEDIANCQSIISPIETCLGLQWNIKIYPRGNNLKSLNKVSIYLYLNDNFSNDFIFSLKIKSSKDKNIIKNINKYENISSSGRGYSSIMTSDDLFDLNNGYLINNKLIIECEVKFAIQNIVPWFKMDNLFNNELFSDFIIKVVDETIHCHKCILCSKSDVFKAMINSTMSESNLNVLTIEDFSPELVKAFLLCIYEPSNIMLQTMFYSIDLLAIACKYDVVDLINAIQEVIIPTINIKNALHTINNPIINNYPIIKNKVIKFISENIDKLIDKDFISEMGNENCIELIKFQSNQLNNSIKDL